MCLIKEQELEAQINENNPSKQDQNQNILKQIEFGEILPGLKPRMIAW